MSNEPKGVDAYSLETSHSGHTYPEVGPAWPDAGWVPTPRYLLRRDRILANLSGVRPGRTLEIGSGSGAFLYELKGMGFDCEGVEISQEAIGLCESLHGKKIKISSQLPELKESFSLIFASEVLEHIEDDVQALYAWIELLENDGLLIITVPSHMKKWGASDEWAGHFRRYEKKDLSEKLRCCGLTIVNFECYGFPLSNVLESLSAGFYRKRVIRNAAGEIERFSNNARSGIDRGPATKLFGLLSSRLGRMFLRISYRIQALFLGRELGSGYLVVARKS
ncbi:class I SAM-dependent methyltransferase [Xanthomonas campestris]|uniref:class I SAM-dependent methyltransferase n=1 Tax=Xanthomonas campestris TaxID=339 RepID=UPI0023E96A24|nr:SAM-dependent methyltransferase [Xanthomonas campestris]